MQVLASASRRAGRLCYLDPLSASRALVSRSCEGEEEAAGGASIFLVWHRLATTVQLHRSQPGLSEDGSEDGNWTLETSAFAFSHVCGFAPIITS